VSGFFGTTALGAIFELLTVFGTTA